MTTQKMNKSSREGSALVMALVVVIVGSTIIGIIFNITFRHAWFAPREAAVFVDHTAVLDLMQAEMAGIIQTNEAAGEIVLVSTQLVENRANSANPPHTDISALATLAIDGNNFRREVLIADGVGRRLRAEVSVFDMAFDLAWLNMGAIIANADPELPPPSFFVEDPIDPFGAYLIRVVLFDTDGNRVRMAEKAFVQTLSAP